MNRDFALAREIIQIIHDHKNGHFSKFLLAYEDFVSGKSFVPFYDDFSNCNEIPRRKYLPPFHERFLYRKSLFKNVLNQNFFYLSTDFQNFCCTFCDKLNAALCQENISVLNNCKISSKKGTRKL